LRKNFRRKQFNRPPILKIIANERIPHQEMRVVDQTGQQLGVLPRADALQKAKEQGLDLILITDKTNPVICKIMSYGKYAYQEGKKDKKQRQTGPAGEMKSVRITFNISPHDMDTRAKSVEKFLKKGYKVRIETKLSGREKYMDNFVREKINLFLEKIKSLIAFKVEKELKKQPRGYDMIIVRQ
jgi:translation initiation factor IF-3